MKRSCPPFDPVASARSSKHCWPNQDEAEAEADFLY
jgi:hypothetical protein